MGLRKELEKILANDPWQVRDKLAQFVANLNEEDYREYKQRTGRQNRALHKYFTLLSKQWSDAGLTVPYILSFTADIQPSPFFVKWYWQEYQVKILGKGQTRDLDKLEDIDKVYDELNLFIGEKLKLDNIPFPNEEDPAPLKDNQSL